GADGPGSNSWCGKTSNMRPVQQAGIRRRDRWGEIMRRMFAFTTALLVALPTIANATCGTRGHAVMREIDVLDLLPHVVKHHAAFERDGAQMRCQQRKLVRRQARQKSIELSVFELPNKRGRAIWHWGRS